MRDDFRPAAQDPNRENFYFSHERLEVYPIELSFVAWVTDLLEGAETSGAKRLREVTDQLDRASLSTLLNTAEGNGKRQRPIRARFFDDARGSATECAACLDALVAKRAVDEGQVIEGKRMLAHVVAILTRLIDIFEGTGNMKEEDVPYRAADSGVVSTSPCDNENEKENEKE
jgi:four helix bundle protein